MHSFVLFLRRQLAPPIYADETQNRRAWLLAFLVNFHIVLAVLVWVAFSLVGVGSRQAGWIALSSVIPVLGLRWLMHRQQLNLAALIFISMMAILMPAAAYLIGSTITNGTVTAFQLLTMVIAGLLLGGRWVWVFVVFTVGVNSVMVYAELNGWYAIVNENQQTAVLVAQVIVYTATAILLALTNHLIKDAFTRLKAENEERRRAEAAVRQLNAELEQRVADRTADLLNAKDAADQANRAKSEFLSSMSHELRTPLNGILGYAQILQRRPDTSEAVRRGLKIIHDSGTHLLGLITDILDFAKIEAQRFETVSRPVHVASFLDSVAGLMRLRAEEKHLTFIFEPAVNLPLSVQVDERRLRQVLLNLLGNAVKFTERGYVAFRVQATPASEPGAVTLHVEVEDSGPGLTPAEIERLFRPFEQMGNARQREQGVGLGLAISQRLVQLMGGDITVASTPGAGSVFTFSLVLPLSTALPADTATPTRHLVGYRGPRRKILIADDKVYNRMVFINLLQPLGFNLLEAEDGAQAIARARHDQPDAILMDLAMPVLIGFEAVQTLRQDATTAKMVIIGASASVFDAEKRGGMIAGCDAFISKPVDVAELCATLERVLQLEWTYADDEPPPQPTVAPLEANVVMPLAADLAELYALVELGDLARGRSPRQNLGRFRPPISTFC